MFEKCCSNKAALPVNIITVRDSCRGIIKCLLFTIHNVRIKLKVKSWYKNHQDWCYKVFIGQLQLLWLKVTSLLCARDRVCSGLQLGFLTPSCHGLFPCSGGQSSFNPAVLLVVRTRRINHRCPAQRHGKAVNKFKRGPGVLSREGVKGQSITAGLVGQILTR